MASATIKRVKEIQYAFLSAAMCQFVVHFCDLSISNSRSPVKPEISNTNKSYKPELVPRQKHAGIDQRIKKKRFVSV